MATADDQMGQKSEPTRDPVNVTLPKCGRNFQIMGRVHETTKCDYPTILVLSYIFPDMALSENLRKLT